jgi:hypothetical protein
MEQPGNRAAIYPKVKQEPFVEVVENPLKYTDNLESGAAGGGAPWVSHPQPEHQYLPHNTGK